MNWTRLLSSYVVPFTLCAATVVEDTSSLPFLNPDLEKRQVAKLRLANALEVLLVSDPAADLSAASMAVECGSWNDPIEYPGMAHFCEHMLFMGSEKYPDENGFMEKLANFGGMTNAFTADDRTVYMFSSRKEGFLELLDHFSRFYIDPRFDTRCIARELHAVDQEFAKNIQHDGWRIYMISKEMGNPEHPNRMFSIGNSETLSHIPQSALKKWHQQHYGANRMHLAIYSSLPMETLREKLEEYFSDIPTAEQTPHDPELSLLSSRQKGHITYVAPFQNLQSVILRWELPTDLAQDSSQPAQLTAFALARAQKNNLEEELKSAHLIDHISISTDTQGGNAHRFFDIQLMLTDAGLQQIDTVILRCFQALAHLKKEGIPPFLFEEKNALSKLHYQFQSRQDAFSYIRSLAESLPDESLESYPRMQLLGSNYDPEKLERVAEYLEPQNCAITVVAPPEKTQIAMDRKERWLGAEYAIRPISTEWLQLWSLAEPHPNIKMAPPNPFLPDRLDAVEEELQNEVPEKIAENEFGVAYYARCPEFKSPEISHTLHIWTPLLRPDAKSYVLGMLYLDHITDQINPILSAASSAGLSAFCQIDRSHLILQMLGFSEKSPLLLEELLRHLKHATPTQSQFELYRARHDKLFANEQKDLAFKQAKALLDCLINKGKPTAKEKLAALRALSYEEFTQFCKTLFDQVYLQAVFNGNLTQKQALACWLDTLHAFGKAPFPPEHHPKLEVLQLDPTKGPYRILQSTEVQGNASLLLIDEGTFSFQKRGVQEVLSSALKEAFFQELRTKQKTGYVAISDGQEIEGRLYHFFIVQSNSHQPEDLLHRFELFLENYVQNFAQEINAERFATLRSSAIDSLQTRFRNLKYKAALWNLLAFQWKGDFAFVQKRIAALQELSYEEFTSIAKGFLSRDNRKRLALLFEGKIAHPFAYETLDFDQWREVAEYSLREECVAASADPLKEE